MKKKIFHETQPVSRDIPYPVENSFPTKMHPLPTKKSKKLIVFILITVIFWVLIQIISILSS